MLLGFDFSSGYATTIYVVGGLLALIAIVEKAFGGATWLWRRLAGSPDAARRQDHDQRLLREIRAILPREQVTDMREHDFGASWPGRWMHQINELAHRNAVEDRFLDRKMEKCRAVLHARADELSLLFAEHSWPHDRNPDMQNVGVTHDGPDHPHTRLWQERRSILNSAVGKVAQAYDALLETARKKTLL